MPDTHAIHGFFQPTRYFMVVGAGDAPSGLVAFDRALLQAGVGDVNLVKLSSIVGPGCTRIAPVTLVPGSLVGVAYAFFICDQPGTRIASAIALAHPADPSRASVLMEHSAIGSREEVEAKVIEMARQGLQSRGLEVARVEAMSVEHVVCTVGTTIAACVEV